MKEGKQEAFLEVMAQLIEGSQNEEGNIEYDLYVDTEKLNTFTLLEKWKDQAALDFHKTTDHYVNNGGKIGGLCNKVELNRLVPFG